MLGVGGCSDRLEQVAQPDRTIASLSWWCDRFSVVRYSRRIIYGVRLLSLMNPFGDTKRPSSILCNVEELPADSWLYIFESVAEMEANTLCLPISFDSEDPEDVEQFVRGNGLKEFSTASDLEGLCTNTHVRLHHPPLLSHG
jgi:hypothetical protein